MELTTLTKLQKNKPTSGSWKREALRTTFFQCNCREKHDALEAKRSHLLHPLDLLVELGHPLLVLHDALHLFLLPLCNHEPSLALLQIDPMHIQWWRTAKYGSAPPPGHPDPLGLVI